MEWIHSYPKVYSLGHAAVKDLFSDFPVYVQEKVDGSQISFKWDDDGDLYVRSKGKMQYAPDGSADTDALFEEAIEYLKGITPSDRIIGYVFRAEWLQGPKHNIIAYDRRPKNGFVLFDVEEMNQWFLLPEEVAEFAEALGIEAVTTIDVLDSVPSMETLDEWLNLESALGGHNIEGVVLKNYHVFGPDKKVLMAKYVSEEFKEVRKKRPKVSNDVVEDIIESLRTEARWRKAVQHLRERGELTMSPKDIGPLLREVATDITEEEEDWIKEQLWKAFRKQILKGAQRGFPEWYKRWLAESQIGKGT